MVGDLDDVEIVLDDDHRIAPIDKFGQYVEQLADILEMESRRGFVQNIKRATRIALGEFARKFGSAGSRRPTESYRAGRASDNPVPRPE